MSYEIIWLPEAETTLAKNIDYLTEEWDSKSLEKFINLVEKALHQIEKYPHSYPLHNSTKNIRRFKINKRIFLYYKVIDDNTIELLTFWNTARNPEDLKF